MSRALPLFHSISSFYLPFMSLRWLPHSVLQIGENFNMFLIYFQAWFIFVYIKHQPFAYIQPITFAYVNNNCSLIATLLSLHLLFFRQQPVQPFFHSFLPAFSFLQPCVSATQQPIPFFVFTTIATHPIVFRQPFLSIYLTVVFNQPSFNPFCYPVCFIFSSTTQPACNQLMS